MIVLETDSVYPTTIPSPNDPYKNTRNNEIMSSTGVNFNDDAAQAFVEAAGEAAMAEQILPNQNLNLLNQVSSTNLPTNNISNTNNTSN